MTNKNSRNGNQAERNIPRFLFFEDIVAELKLTLRILTKENIRFDYQSTDTEFEFKKLVVEFEPDLIIADFNLPNFNGMEALEWVQKEAPEIPFIFVTGSMGEERAVETLKQGASDFVLKGNLIRLPMVIKRALKEIEERKQKISAQKAFLTSEARYQQLIDNAPVGICELSFKGQVTTINRRGAEIFGTEKKNIHIKDIFDQKDLSQYKNWLKEKPNGKSFNGVFHAQDGKKLIDLTLIPHFNIETKVKTLIGVSQDITHRAKMESELQEKNALLESIFNAIPDVIYLKDKEGRYLMVNKSFEKISNLKAKDILNKKDKDLIEKTLADESEKADKKVLKSQALVTTMQTLTDHKGEVLIFDNHKSPIFDSVNKVVGIVGISRDVTESIHSQEKLKHSEAMLLEAENVANMGSWEFYVSLEKLFYSLGAAKMLGIQLSERTLKYKSFLKLCHPEDRLKIGEAFRSAVLDGESFQIEHRILQSDGSILWFQTKGKPSQNDRGNIDKIVGTVQDVTEQKRSHEKLEKSQLLLKEAQSMAQMGSFDWNITQNILNCSEEFNSILQFGQSDLWLTFDHYLERIHPSDRELSRKKIFDALATAETYDIEHRILLPNHSVKTVRAIGRFKTDSQNQVENLFGTIQDISKKKEAENALLEGQELERARIAREIHDGIGQLLAATNFNLAALDGMPELEVEQQLEKIHKTLEMTMDEARRITKNLSTKILDELGLEKAIYELCNEAQAISGISFKATYQLEKDDLGEKARVTVYRIIQESVNNMTKYSEASTASVKLAKKPNHILLYISDDGKGFDTKDPNYKSGHGLTNLKERTKTLHGFIDINSKPNNGTTIQVRIPFENKNNYDKN
ncbi:PAS domain S-box-containing protein [Reichenbachiella faecimaris]|uniref:histidine kinase n=1 Tax=Reichenbachiella faecimaris TaxID=692418 RepID=A0A1W2GI15_REIFA|nr:PAS domain S-box protein [Reichenbachiella faecimaris]SMD35998.1 PAS domain S-box-containing protein [Reichenbachiella faecimaris]